MRYLIIVIISSLFTGLAYFSLALALSPAPISAEYWVREMIVIKREIAKKYIGQRKIIIASGSSTLFNIDTQQLSDELKVPVINLGLHAGLPLKNILAEAESAAEKGDIVVLPLEPSYYCVKEPTPWQIRNIIAWDHDEWMNRSIIDRIRGLAMMNPDIIFELIEARIREKIFPKSIESRLAALNDGIILAKSSSSSKSVTFAYSAHNLDNLGNMQNTAGSQYAGNPLWSADNKIDICSESWNLLQSFTAQMAGKGVEIYFANTPYIENDNLNPERIEATSKQFIRELSLLAPVLDSKSELIFSRSLFFNTDLHLNAEGRKRRTEILSQALQSKKPMYFRSSRPMRCGEQSSSSQARF